MGRRGSHGQRNNEGRFAVSSSLLLRTRQRISSCNLPGSDKALTAIIELDHSAVASVNQLQHYRQGLLAPLRSKKGAVQALLSFDDGKDKAPRLSNMLTEVATLLFTATPGELYLRINDLTAMESTALRVTMSDLVTEHGQVCLVNGGQEGNVS